MSSIDWKAVAKELLLAAATVVAIDLSAALLAFSDNPGAVLDDPTAWAVGLGRAILPKVIATLAAKGRELISRLFGLGA